MSYRFPRVPSPLCLPQTLFLSPLPTPRTPHTIAPKLSNTMQNFVRRAIARRQAHAMHMKNFLFGRAAVMRSVALLRISRLAHREFAFPYAAAHRGGPRTRRGCGGGCTRRSCANISPPPPRTWMRRERKDPNFGFLLFRAPYTLIILIRFYGNPVAATLYTFTAEGPNLYATPTLCVRTAAGDGSGVY